MSVSVVVYQVQARLRDGVYEWRQDLQRLVSVAEDDHVVSQQLVAVDADAFVAEHLQLRLCGLPVVESEVIAGFEIHCDL